MPTCAGVTLFQPFSALSTTKSTQQLANSPSPQKGYSKLHAWHQFSCVPTRHYFNFIHNILKTQFRVFLQTTVGCTLPMGKLNYFVEEGSILSYNSLMVLGRKRVNRISVIQVPNTACCVSCVAVTCQTVLQMIVWFMTRKAALAFTSLCNKTSKGYT